MLDIKQTAVHRVTSCRHIMDINVAITACLDFFCRHKELLIQFFVELVENKASFR